MDPDKRRLLSDHLILSVLPRVKGTKYGQREPLTAARPGRPIWRMDTTRHRRAIA